MAITVRVQHSLRFLVISLAGAIVVAAQEPQRPVFRGDTSVVLVDAQVVGRDGEPLSGLTASDFEVQIGGKARRVVSVEFIRHDVRSANASALTGAEAATQALPVTDPPPGQVRVARVPQDSPLQSREKGVNAARKFAGANSHAGSRHPDR